MAGFSDKAGDLSAFEWRGLGLEPLNCVNSGMQLSDQIYPADPVRRLGDQPAECLGMAASHRFQPSRRRTFAATSLTASTGLQPTGRALPPLVPTGLAPDQHWQRACFGTEHPLAQLPNLPPKLLQAAENLESLGGGIVSWRKEQMKRIRHLAESLQPVQAQWQQGLHPQVRRIIGKWHLPLLHILAKEAGSEDLFFNLDYSAGVRCVGRAAHSFVMPLKFTRPTLSVEALLSQAKVRNPQLIASVRSSGDAELDRASLQKTQNELDSKVMLGPWEASDLPSWVAVVSRRFPIWEHHGSAGRRKCRNIDEMSESLVNATVEDYETYVPRGIEHILALIRHLQVRFGLGVQLEGFTADFKAAYRQVAVSPSQYKFQGVAWWDCLRATVMIGVLTALPFGARRAPANWGRLVLLLMTIAWHHFSLLVLDYVDDVNGVEPHFSAESARQTWVELVSLLGLTLDMDKCSSSASTCFDSLGVSWALSSPHALVQILPSRLAGLQDDIQAIIAANWLRPGHAARLRGKLGFALVAAFGRFGRAQLSAIKRRQYASGGKNFQLSAVLRAQLEWWLVHLRSLPGRGVPRSPAEKFLVAYSDGEGSGKVAVCLTFLDRSTEFCCAEIPHSIQQRWGGVNNIHRIEAVGPPICFLTWPEKLRGQLLLFFIDNQSALGSMVGGWSHEEVLNDITALSWSLAASLQCFVFFEYVPSASNIIDAASRAQSTADLSVYYNRGWSLVPPCTPWHRLQ